MRTILESKQETTSAVTPRTAIKGDPIYCEVDSVAYAEYSEAICALEGMDPAEYVGKRTDCQSVSLPSNFLKTLKAKVAKLEMKRLEFASLSTSGILAELINIGLRLERDTQNNERPVPPPFMHYEGVQKVVKTIPWTGSKLDRISITVYPVAALDVKTYAFPVGHPMRNEHRMVARFRYFIETAVTAMKTTPAPTADQTEF